MTTVESAPSRVAVLGAGVVGQVYAGLLADAGHEVALIARGARGDHLREHGVVLERDGRASRPSCRIVDTVTAAGPLDALLVAVRGDQLASVQIGAARSEAESVVCLANPLGQQESFRTLVGPERTVFAFSGIGGLVDAGAVHFHVVRQQPTVVDVATPAGEPVADLLRSTGLPIRAETRMSDWLATHNVFIAGIGSVVLAEETGAKGVGDARELVAAVSEAFAALRVRGHTVTPGGLRTIFGRVPAPFAVRYWRRQLAGPMVQVSIRPHVVATRESEFPSIADHALALVGEDAPRYRRLVAPYTRG